MQSETTPTRNIRPQRRVAFLFGQSDYLHAPALPSPISDCKLLAKTLEELGFTVFQYFNLDQNGITSRLSDIVNAVKGPDLVFFYYSGHGMELAGSPYILPIEASVTSAEFAEQEAISLSSFFDSVRSSSPITLAMFDACRDNPFPSSTGGSNTRSLKGGSEPAMPGQPADHATEIDPPPSDEGNSTPPATEQLLYPPETLTRPMSAHNNRSLSCFETPRGIRRGGMAIVYATDRGQVAFDGSGSNSPFAEAVSQAILTPGLELTDLLNPYSPDAAACG